MIFSVTCTSPGPPPAEVTSARDPSLNVAAGFESAGDGAECGGDDDGACEDVVEDPEPQADMVISEPTATTSPIARFTRLSLTGRTP